MKTVKGNLITLAEQGEFDVIVHGCNCFCKMGSGIALEVKKRYPAACQADYDTEPGDINKLGNFTSFDTGPFTIINAYTQFAPGSGEDVFEYDAFQVILQKLSQWPDKRYGFPMIGAGLAGGDWDRIREKIEIFHNAIENYGGSASVVEFDGT